MRDLIENGEFYKRARTWYTEMFVYPYSLRSEALVLFSAITIALTILVININALFPLNVQIAYAISVEDTSEYSAKISNANFYGDDTYKSVAKIFVETYVQVRESYDYVSLSNNLLFLKNTSTKPIYNQYNDYISIDNASSPALILEQNATKKAAIISVDFVSKDRVIAKFNTQSFKNTGKIIEDKDWEADITFLIDQVSNNIKDNTPFNFTVSEYKVKLLRDNNVV